MFLPLPSFTTFCIICKTKNYLNRKSSWLVKLNLKVKKKNKIFNSKKSRMQRHNNFLILMENKGKTLVKRQIFCGFLDFIVLVCWLRVQQRFFTRRFGASSPFVVEASFWRASSSRVPPRLAWRQLPPFRLGSAQCDTGSTCTG